MPGPSQDPVRTSFVPCLEHSTAGDESPLLSVFWALSLGHGHSWHSPWEEGAPWGLQEPLWGWPGGKGLSRGSPTLQPQASKQFGAILALGRENFSSLTIVVGASCCLQELSCSGCSPSPGTRLLGARVAPGHGWGPGGTHGKEKPSRARLSLQQCHREGWEVSVSLKRVRGGSRGGSCPHRAVHSPGEAALSCF